MLTNRMFLFLFCLFFTFVTDVEVDCILQLKCKTLSWVKSSQGTIKLTKTQQGQKVVWLCSLWEDHILSYPTVTTVLKLFDIVLVFWFDLLWLQRNRNASVLFSYVLWCDVVLYLCTVCHYFYFSLFFRFLACFGCFGVLPF